MDGDVDRRAASRAGGAMSDEHGPPRWAEALLERLIHIRERDSIVGDLREEFIESVLPHRGRIHACFWYVLQLVSFVPRFIEEGLLMGKALLRMPQQHLHKGQPAGTGQRAYRTLTTLGRADGRPVQRFNSTTPH
jgi:hypothetical protein